MARIVVLAVAAFAALAFAGWHFRGRLQAVPVAAPQIQAPAPSPAARQPDVLYTWVDKDGVTHFEQAPGKGAPVVYDGGRITPLPPVEISRSEQGRKKVAESVDAGLHKLRRELEAGARQMREARTAASPDL